MPSNTSRGESALACRACPERRLRPSLHGALLPPLRSPPTALKPSTLRRWQHPRWASRVSIAGGVGGGEDHQPPFTAYPPPSSHQLSPSSSKGWVQRLVIICPSGMEECPYCSLLILMLLVIKVITIGRWEQINPE